MLVVFPIPGRPCPPMPISRFAAGQDGSTHRDNNMRAIPLFRYYLEPLNCLLVPDNVVQNLWTVFFDPGTRQVVGAKRKLAYHGSS